MSKHGYEKEKKKKQSNKNPKRMINKQKRGYSEGDNRPKSSKKWIIKILLVFVVVFIMFMGYEVVNNVFQQKQTQQDKKEISQKIFEEKQYKEMKIKEIEFEIDEYSSHLNCKIENTTNRKFDQEDVMIVFIKKDNSIVAKFKYRLKEIEAGKEGTLSMISTTNLIDVYDFYIESGNKE